MPIYTNGLEITGPRGPAGPDGNPIGAVIAYMGLIAPSDYLVCDGATYDIAAYSDLAKFFEVQFGSSNFFGGDGEITFSVPDMRDLFLRGCNPNAEERLSGDIGARQEATQHIYIDASNTGWRWNTDSTSTDYTPKNTDSTIGILAESQVLGSVSPSLTKLNKYYTSRPVNMAVLYCIKAVSGSPFVEDYETEDGWHVRKYSDGYVEMDLAKVCSKLNASTAWGGGYVTDYIYGYSYPIMLECAHSVQVYPLVTQDIRLVYAATTQSIMTATPTIRLMRPTSSTSITGTIYYHITGKWK